MLLSGGMEKRYSDMADQKIVEKLKAIVKDPEAMARLKQAQKTAQETINFVREASTVDINALKRVHYNI